MRTAFFHSLLDMAAKDQRIQLVTGDLGFGAVESFAERFPDQFLNVGVAEQNLIGISAGLALSGKIVFAYSISNFPTLRCLEQIRNDVCYHNANVKIVTAGGGFSYGVLGMSHHVTEDLAVMRALPNMTVVAPGDPVETAAAACAMAHETGPAYLRLGRNGEPAIHKDGNSFQWGKAILVCPGMDLTLISTGTLLELALQTAEALGDYGLQARVLSMPFIKPLDQEAVLTAARETRALITLEEHSILGGLGGAVAEVLAESSEEKILFKRIGLPSVFSSHIGSQPYLRAAYGLSKESILESIKNLLGLVRK